jgi:hypothetical protein
LAAPTDEGFGDHRRQFVAAAVMAASASGARCLTGAFKLSIPAKTRDQLRPHAGVTRDGLHEAWGRWMISRGLRQCSVERLAADGA